MCEGVAEDRLLEWKGPYLQSRGDQQKTKTSKIKVEILMHLGCISQHHLTPKDKKSIDDK